MTFTSPLPSVSVPALPLTPYTLERAGQLAGKAAFIDGATGRTMTYGEFEDAVRRQAGGWLESGLAKGEVVAVMAPNCAEYGVIFHAVALAGGVLTTVNPTYTSGEVHHQLVDSGATRLVTIPAFLETATAAIADSAVKEVYVIGEADGYASIASLGTAPPLAEQVPVDLDDVVVLPYSSGTTGLAKGVMLTHRNLVSNIEQTLGTVALQEDDAFVAVLPFFHIYGMQVLMNTGLRAGATIVTMPRFDLEQFLALHGEHRLTRVRRAADGRRAGEASGRRQLRPFRASVDLLRRGAVVGRARDRVRRAARVRGRAGLRHDRAVTGEPRHAVGHVQARVGRRDGPEHRGQHRRSLHAVAARRRRRRRGVGARPAGDEGLLEQRVRDEEHDR